LNGLARSLIEDVACLADLQRSLQGRGGPSSVANRFGGGLNFAVASSFADYFAFAAACAETEPQAADNVGTASRGA
jgi:hypothetical protein